MPTLKPNPSRIILAWNRQKTDVVLSKESNETVTPGPKAVKTTISTSMEETTQSSEPIIETIIANFTPTTIYSTLSTTVEANPITVSLDLANVMAQLTPTRPPPMITTLSSCESQKTTTTTTTIRPVDHHGSSSGSMTTSSDFMTTNSGYFGLPAPYSSTTVSRKDPQKNTKTSSPTTKKPPTITTQKPKRTTNSLPASSPPPQPAASLPEQLEQVEEFINQIHKPPSSRPYVAERDCGIRSMPPPPSADGTSASFSRRNGRVVGGRDSLVGEFPWSVLIRETTLLGFFVKTKCGGALIDLKWVLTAAHCKPGMFGSLEVVVGENDLSNSGNSNGRAQTSSSSKQTRLKPIVRKVKRMIIHRDYNPSNFDNDIALLELETPYQVQPHVVPICLPEKEESFIGQQAMVAGWGKLSFGGPVPSVLQVAKLPVIGNKQCQDMYHNSGHMKIISDSFLCAGYADGGQDSCEGDSGGPLQIQRPDDGRWVLAGTVSHGIKCAEPNLPGIYIRIAAYLPWIKAVTYQQDHNKRYGYRRQFTRTGSVQLLA